MNNVSKTLYIPLYGKALVSSRGILLRDEKAREIWAAEGFPLKGKAASKWLAYYMGMRSAVFDRWLEENLREMSDALVLHPGCGLDSRCCRVTARGRGWYDVDFPQVIEERKKYFPETENYRMLPGDVRDGEWLQSIPRGGDALVVMEGLSMYLTGEERRQLLQRISGHFDRVKILVDAYSVFAAKASRYKNPVNEVGVTELYGMDDPMELTRETGLTFAGELEITPEELIGQLPKGERGIFRLLYGGRMAKSLYRLYAYEK